jgi:hypothetical protein
MVRGWIAYYGQYTRSALYPLARYSRPPAHATIKKTDKPEDCFTFRVNQSLAKTTASDVLVVETRGPFKGPRVYDWHGPTAAP